MPSSPLPGITGGDTGPRGRRDQPQRDSGKHFWLGCLGPWTLEKMCLGGMAAAPTLLAGPRDVAS